MPITYLYFYFILFVIVTIYYLFPNALRWIVLLVSSFTLYTVFGGKQALMMMACSILAAYLGARGIIFFKESGKYVASSLCFWLALIVIVGILGWYNYFNFVIENINYVTGKLGKNFCFPLIQALSPLGISFYSLSLISYLVDVYWGIQKEEKNIGKIMLYGCYFPVVTTGPILRYNKFHEELIREKSLDYENICFSLQRILWGIFKKAVIADYLYIIVHEIFQNFTDYSGLIVLGGSYLSAIQLYLNFSASIDIVLGISQLFGIKLSENFDHPFASCTITEVFRKWHISLGNWLKDYIYYPLMKSSFIQNIKDKVGNRFGKKAGKRTGTFSAMLVMWILNGVWHGAQWKYIIGVGVLLWFIMLLEDLFEPYRLKIVKKYSINENSIIYMAVRRFVMYTKFSMMMVFFSADGVVHGMRIILHMIRNLFLKFDFSFLLNLSFSKERIVTLLVSFSIYLCATHISLKVDIRNWLAEKKIWIRWGVYYLIILCIILYSANGMDVMEGFIYAQF